MMSNHVKSVRRISADVRWFRLICVLMLWSVVDCALATGLERMLLSGIGTQEDPRVRSFIQLSDRRMVIMTLSGADIYDGTDLVHLVPDSSLTMALPRYEGYHHLYLTHGGRYLWIKNRHSIQCIDIDNETYVAPSQVLMTLGCAAAAEDLFGDCRGRLWIINDERMTPVDGGKDISLDSRRTPLLDVMDRDSDMYLFYHDGSVSVNSIDGYRNAVYIPDDNRPMSTSHVIEHAGSFYQIRNGAEGELWKFSPDSCKWDCLFRTPMRLNTLAMTDTMALISSVRGLFTVDLHNGISRHYPLVRTRSGNILASEISSVYTDVDGGLWLGLYNRGVLHYHPGRYIYRVIPKSPKAVRSLPLSASSVFSETDDGAIHIADNDISLDIVIADGDSIIVRQCDDSRGELAGEYGSGACFTSSDGSILFNSDRCYELFIRNRTACGQTDPMPVISHVIVNGESYTSPDGTVMSRKKDIELEYNQNFITVEASIPRYDGSSTTFQYMLEGIDRGWNHAEGNGTGGRLLKASYTALPPGEYLMKIKGTTGTDSPEARLVIRIKRPWWDTPVAWCCYIIAGVIIIVVIIRVYSLWLKKKAAARQREILLFERIRHLIAEVDYYRTEAPRSGEMPVTAASVMQHKDGASPVETDDRGAEVMSDSDRQFIARAVELVEMNINTPGYSVEQLSRDMCMDRTGLYRKLTILLDQSPSLFIRDIRLRNAARMLLEGKMSVTDIAEATGFSSTSYMSKCFQERYGCRPSEYARSHS